MDEGPVENIPKTYLNEANPCEVSGCNRSIPDIRALSFCNVVSSAVHERVHVASPEEHIKF